MLLYLNKSFYSGFFLGSHMVLNNYKSTNYVKSIAGGILTGYSLDYVNSKIPENLKFILPSLAISYIFYDYYKKSGKSEFYYNKYYDRLTKNN